MKRILYGLAIGAFAIAASSAFAGPGGQPDPQSQPTDNPQAHAYGQPNASCEDTPNTPGNSAAAPGSAFNPDGTAGSHYAGEQPQNSNNPAAVSQYDSACAHQPN